MAGEPDVAGLRILYEEARAHLRSQVDAIEFADDRASAVFRFNAVIVGVIAAVSSGLVGAPLTRFVPFLIVGGLGMVSLVASTIYAVRAFTKRDVAVGLDADLLVEAANRRVPEPAVLQGAIESYRDGIQANFLVMEVAAGHLEKSLHLLTAGIVLLAGAAMVLILEGIL